MNKFSGFNTMALALAAAGLAPVMGVSAAAALVTQPGRYKFLLLSAHPGAKKKWVMVGEDGRGREWGMDYGDDIDYSDVTVFEEKWLDSWADLSMEDRKKQGGWVEGGKAGWLSPTGEFYSCNYEGHARLARQVLHRHWTDLEREGWVHVDGAGEMGCYTYRTAKSNEYGMILTPEQEKWLAANGHDLDPYGKRKRNKLPELIKLGDYQLDADADRAAFERQMKAAGLTVEPKKSGLAAFR